MSNKFVLENENPFVTPICNTCKWTNNDGTCKAFPDGIPILILTGDDDHSEKAEGQANDLLYTRKE